jgi:HEAT repeat protein
MPGTGNLDERLHYYIQQLRDGDGENAFHCLVEEGPDIIPWLMVYFFFKETDSQVRVTLVDIIRQHEKCSTIPFFAEALKDPNPIVWKAALDGLVSMPCDESVAALQTALDQPYSDKQFHEWVKEALEQVLEKL